MKKTVLASVLAFVLASSFIGTTTAALELTDPMPGPIYEDGTGWKDDEGEYHYYRDGSIVTSSVVTINGTRYVFDKNGDLVRYGCISTKNGKKLFTNENGIVYKELVMDEDYAYFLDANGQELYRMSIRDTDDEYEKIGSAIKREKRGDKIFEIEAESHSYTKEWNFKSLSQKMISEGYILLVSKDHKDTWIKDNDRVEIYYGFDTVTITTYRLVEE